MINIVLIIKLLLIVYLYFNYWNMIIKFDYYLNFLF